MKISELNFKPTITIAEKYRLIQTIMDGLFYNEIYMPEMYEEQFWIAVAQAYATDLEDNAEFTSDEFMDAFYNDGIYERMISTINDGQLNAIITAVDQKIDAILNNSPMDTFFERATDLLNSLGEYLSPEKISGIADAISEMDIEKKIAEAVLENNANKPKRAVRAKK